MPYPFFCFSIYCQPKKTHPTHLPTLAWHSSLAAPTHHTYQTSLARTSTPSTQGLLPWRPSPTH